MTGEDQSLDDLAFAAQANDAALSELLAAIIRDRVAQPAIRRYLFNEDDVDVVEQQVLVGVAFKLDQWSGTGAFSGWVRQIAANEAKDLIRSRERRRTHESTATTRTADFVERMSSMLATEADVERCLAELAPELAAPLELRRQGHSYGQIAHDLGVAEGTAKTRVRAARQALALALAELA